MRRLAALLVLALIIITGTATAGIDSFNITPKYGAPVHYIIDYSQNETAYLYNYSINSSIAMTSNNTWIVLASNNNSVIETVDTRQGIDFIAHTEQHYKITTPGWYRHYYFVFHNGLYETTAAINLTLFSNTNATETFPANTTPSLVMLQTGTSDDASYLGGLFGIIGGIIGGILITRKRK